MPKRRKKGGTKNLKASKPKFDPTSRTVSRDTTKSYGITSPNASLEQSISNGYDVIWNDRSPITDQQPVIGHSLMRALQGKEGLVQKKEGHQLIELIKSNMKSIHHQHTTSDSEVQVKRSRRQQLEISKAQNELKQLAKRLQYYDDRDMEGEDGSVMHQQQEEEHSHRNTDNSRIFSDVQVASSVATSIPNSTACTNITNTVIGGDSGVVESDTDTMSCCGDDSSPDQYQPIGSHHCKGVAKTVDKCTATQDGGVAKTRPCQSTNSTSNNFPHISETGIISDDDPELDRIFASVEMTTSDHYNDTIDDEQFWNTAAIELSHQEVGLAIAHSTPCRPPPLPTVTNSNDISGADFIDMVLTYSDDIDVILNQN